MKNTRKSPVGRKFAAWLLMFCMVLATFTGCKKDDSTLFSIIKEASEFESYTFEGTGEAVAAGETVFFEMSGKVSGNDWSVSVKVWNDEYDIELGEILIYLDDSLYVNVDAIVDAVSEFVPGINVNAVVENMYHIPLGWYELPMPEGYFAINDEQYQKSSELSLTMLEEMLAGIDIEKNKSTFTINISEPAQIATIMENLALVLENHEADFMDYVLEMDYEKLKDALIELLDVYGNAIVNVMVKINEEKNLGMTEEEFTEARTIIEEEIASLKEEQVGEITDEMKAQMQAELEMGIDEAVLELREGAEAMKNYEMGDNTFSVVLTNSMSGKSGKKEYTVKAEMTAVADEESVLATAEFTKKQGKAEVVLPAEDVYMLEDWLYNVISAVMDLSGEDVGE